MTRDYRIFRGYLEETGEIWEATGIRFVYEAAVRTMKAWAHIHLGGNYTVRIYAVDERIQPGREDADECVLTVLVDAGPSWTETGVVKGYWNWRDEE